MQKIHEIKKMAKLELTDSQKIKINHQISSHDIPTIKDVRNMERLSWETPLYSDNDIKLGIKIIEDLPLYQDFLIKENGGYAPFYNIPYTFIIGPIFTYITYLHGNQDLEEIQDMINYLDKIYAKNSDSIVWEWLFHNPTLDKKDFRKFLLKHMKVWKLRDFIQKRLRDIYWPFYKF